MAPASVGAFHIYKRNGICIDWAQTAQLPKEVTLSEAEHIFTSMYVNANICDIKQHYPDAFYNPAIDRLYRLKEHMEDNM